VNQGPIRLKFEAAAFAPGPSVSGRRFLVLAARLVLDFWHLRTFLLFISVQQRTISSLKARKL
jgi:hypothetical protein